MGKRDSHSVVKLHDKKGEKTWLSCEREIRDRGIVADLQEGKGGQYKKTGKEGQPHYGRGRGKWKSTWNREGL